MSTSNSASPRHLLMIAANPTTSTTMDGPVGFWASELTHAWYEFREAGYDVTIASPAGGRIDLDALSDPRDASGYSAHDVLSRGFLETPELGALLAETPSLASLDLDAFDAVYVVGGQAPMFGFRENEALRDALRRFYEAGKITAAVCHGVAALLDVELSDGARLISGKQMTGFANSEEDYVDQIMGQKVMPFRIEDEARAAGANFLAAGAFQPHAVRDGLLITGQQQNSGRRAAQEIIRALGC